MKSRIAIVIMFFAASATAVTPATWSHVSEADFADGEFEGVSVTSLGELMLSRQADVLISAEAAPAVISGVAELGGAVYVASGVDGQVYRIAGGKTQPLVKFDKAIVTSLKVINGELLAAVGGESAGVYRLSAKGDKTEVWSSKDVKYAWAIAGSNKVFYVATGSPAAVYAVTAGKAEQIYSAGSRAKNILSLAVGANGKIYAGTDENGLVVEIEPGTKSSRILLDADEQEVSAIVVGADGSVFAATSDSAKAKASAASARTEDIGRAERARVTAPEDGGEGDGGDSGEGDEGETEMSTDAPADGPADTGEQAKPDGDAATVEAPASQPASQPAAPAQAAGDAPADEPARQSAKPARPRVVSTPATRAAMMRAAPGGPRGGGRPDADQQVGNAVYRISSDGMVRVVFRRPVSIHAMLPDGDGLLLGTGNDGQIYSVSIDGDESAMLVDLEADQVTALALASGSVLVGTANKGSVVRIGSGFAAEGTYVSPVLDAEQIARWGTAAIVAELAQGSRATIATRSGNVSEPEEDTWTEWSAEQDASGAFIPIRSPAGRFLQYRLTLSSGLDSPRVQQVELVYQVDNLRPRLAAVQVAASAKAQQRQPEDMPGPKAFRHVLIRAMDPNDDELVYTVSFRELGSQDWIAISEDQSEPQFIWDTRTTGDGRYELRVTASDKQSNPPGSELEASRVSSVIVVDNTAPVLKEISAAVQGDRAVVSGIVEDATSRIAAIRYSVNSAEDWTAVLPVDGICDSSQERFTFRTESLKPGRYRIAVAVEDLYGNVGYGSLSVTVK